MGKNKNGTSEVSEDKSTVSNSTEGAGFTYLFDGMNYKGTLLANIKNESKGIYVTKITTQNPYYYHTATPLGDGIYGLNKAVTINNANLVVGTDAFENTGSNAFYTDDTYKLARNYSWCYNKSTGAGPTLVNCVGWVYGRAFEVWQQAINQGYIKKNSDGIYEYTDKFTDSEETLYVTGEFKPELTPVCNAYNFIDKWPKKSERAGYDIITSANTLNLKINKYRPLPGDIICWKSTKNANGSYGHVAFVEAVYNRGTKDEYIVISESGWHKARLPYLVTANTVYKFSDQVKSTDSSYVGNYYPYSNSNYILLGFLRSPISQLSTLGGEVTTEVEPDDTEEEVAQKVETAQNKINSQYRLQTELSEGTKVRVTWVGNQKADGSGKRLNFLDEILYVKEIDKTKEYPYGLAKDMSSDTLGYFQRSSLSVSLTPSVIR